MPRFALLALPFALVAGCDFAQYSPPPDLTFQSIPSDLEPAPAADLAFPKADLASAAKDQGTLPGDAGSPDGGGPPDMAQPDDAMKIVQDLASPDLAPPADLSGPQADLP